MRWTATWHRPIPPSAPEYCLAAPQGRVAGFSQAALPATVPLGALGGGALAAALGNVPVLVAAAAIALLAGATLWAPMRAQQRTAQELPLPDQAQ